MKCWSRLRYESCNKIHSVKRAGADNTTKNPNIQHICVRFRKLMVKDSLVRRDLATKSCEGIYTSRINYYNSSRVIYIDSVERSVLS